MQRVYFHYEKREDWQNGMYRDCLGGERDAMLEKAIAFTGNAKLYGKWMLQVIKKWHFACIVNLTNTGMNRQAWVGHAACCMAINCPEDITRMAWWKLTQQQQDEANLQADNAIAKWERRYNMDGLQLYFQSVKHA